MALPLAIPAVVAEGLVFIRRAIVTYRLTKQLIDPDDKLFTLVSKGLKHHFSVKGEEFYLYLLGEKMINSIYDHLSVPNQNRLDEGEIQMVVMRTLAYPEFLMSSLDVNSIIASYAHCLGIVWQQYDGNAAFYLERLLSKDDEEADISDIVRSYLISSDSLPERIVQIGHRLGCATAEQEFIVTLLKGDDAHAKIASSWEQAEEDFLGQKVPLYKASTFQGFMLMGAQSILIESRGDVVAYPGEDGIALELSYLPRGRSYPYKPFSYPEISSITSEHVKQITDRVMKLQGLVYSSSSRSYVPISQVEVDKDDNDQVVLTSSSANDSLLFGSGASSDRSSSKMIISMMQKFIEEQPMMDDINEWRGIVGAAQETLKLISNS